MNKRVQKLEISSEMLNKISMFYEKAAWLWENPGPDYVRDPEPLEFLGIKIRKASIVNYSVSLYAQGCALGHLNHM